MNEARKTVLLIGDPVAHSVSPPMQQAAFDALGLPLAYATIRVGRADLPAALSRVGRTALGLNVTAPLKEAVIPLLDAVDPHAAAVGSVNTVRFGRGGSWGTSTDGEGFLAALADAGMEAPAAAVVLGSGGAARAVVAALAARGVSVTVAGRDPQAAHRLVADLSTSLGSGPPPIRLRGMGAAGPALAEAISSAGLLVNATPVGAWHGPGGSPIPHAELLHPDLTVFDLVYRPLRTPLLVAALERGCRVVEGVEMLVRQGARSFEIWTERPAPFDVMRAAALRCLQGEPTPVTSARGGGTP